MRKNTLQNLMFPPGLWLWKKGRDLEVWREREPSGWGWGGAVPILSQGYVSMATVFDTLCQNYYFSAQTIGSG